MSQKIYAHDGAEFLSLFFPSKLYYFHMFGLWNQDLFNNRYSSKHTQLFAEMYLFNCKFVMPYFFEMAFLKDEPRQKHVSLNSKSINKLLFLLVLCLSSYASFWENLTGVECFHQTFLLIHKARLWFLFYLLLVPWDFL